MLPAIVVSHNLINEILVIFTANHMMINILKLHDSLRSLPLRPINLDLNKANLCLKLLFAIQV